VIASALLLGPVGDRPVAADATTLSPEAAATLRQYCRDCHDDASFNGGNGYDEIEFFATYFGDLDIQNFESIIT
jgi:hypothetical protein